MKKFMTNFSMFALAATTAFLLKLPVQASDVAAFAPVFNATFYANAHADLQTAYGTDEALLFQHFLNLDMAEGRQGSAEFMVQAYRANNPDLTAVFGEDLTSYYLHYINNGKAEGRIATTSSVSTQDTVNSPL